MTEKQTYWMVDGEGKKALITGAAERDRWIPLGLSDAGEPAGAEFVYAWHEGIETPAMFSAQSLPVWQAKGWVPGPPPEPVSPFNGDHIPTPAAAPPPSVPASSAPGVTTSETPAAGGKTKEK
jgi:hypothetical protein